MQSDVACSRGSRDQRVPERGSRMMLAHRPWRRLCTITHEKGQHRDERNKEDDGWLGGPWPVVPVAGARLQTTALGFRSMIS